MRITELTIKIKIKAIRIKELKPEWTMENCENSLYSIRRSMEENLLRYAEEMLKNTFG